MSLASELDPATIASVYLNGEHMRALAEVLQEKYPPVRFTTIKQISNPN
jgi:hypothetical protein